MNPILNSHWLWLEIFSKCSKTFKFPHSISHPFDSAKYNGHFEVETNYQTMMMMTGRWAFTTKHIRFFSCKFQLRVIHVSVRFSRIPLGSVKHNGHFEVERDYPRQCWQDVVNFVRLKIDAHFENEVGCRYVCCFHFCYSDSYSPQNSFGFCKI